MLGYILETGGMAEWFKAAVLKTVECQSSVGSNPTPSAIGLKKKFQVSILKSKERWPSRLKALAC